MEALARSTGGPSRQRSEHRPDHRGERPLARLERWLEAEREQLPLWLPVAVGAGVAWWFCGDGPAAWGAALCALAALACGALLLPPGGRARRALWMGAVAAAIGLSLVWWRAERVRAPVLARPVMAALTGRVLRVEEQPARDRVRVTLAPEDRALPPAVRVSIDTANAPQGLQAGERLRLRARLVAPPPPAFPGGYDSAQGAWFAGVGAMGKALGPVERVGSRPPDAAADLRARMRRVSRARVPGSEGGVAAAFVTGDVGGIATADNDAMRTAGLAHLLSISGLHIAAAVAAAIAIARALLALSPRIALDFPVPVLAAGVGALAGIGYTWLSGAEVPTVRSCVAALLVLAALALGREALTLRLVAGGALVIFAFWPEALAGPSFQLTFAAVTAIVAVHGLPPLRRLLERREEGRLARASRGLAGIFLTGLAVEAALAPIAFYHFHREGVYGAFANLVAIPLSTFVIMPLEAGALVLEPLGLAAPFWWLTHGAIAVLLRLARAVAAWPGALWLLGEVPTGAFALAIGGGLWLTLWRTRERLWGLAPMVLAGAWVAGTSAPDLLVTGDGAHLAVRGDDGRLAILRPRARDFVRTQFGERFGDLSGLDDLDDAGGASCSDDLCRVDLLRGGRRWRVLATRTRERLPWAAFVAECAAADIVVSERRLPVGCRPRWLKADRALLARTGGLAVSFAPFRVLTVAEGQGEHPWALAVRPPAPPRPPRASGSGAAAPPVAPAR